MVLLLKERKKNTLHQITLTEEKIEKEHESKNDIVVVPYPHLKATQMESFH